MADNKRKKKNSGKKDSQLVIRINKEERDEFLELCNDIDTSAAREVRKFIRKFVAKHEDEQALDEDND